MNRILGFKQWCLTVIFLFVALFAFSSSSLASTPTITQYSPAQGTIFTVNEANISFTVTDPDSIAATGYYIKVNGALINSYIDYTNGHWEDDTCGGTYWVIDNYTQAVISGKATNLGDGPQVIEVSVKDQAGNPVVFSWVVNTSVKPTFSNQSPANGTKANGNVPITVKLTDNYKIDPLSIVFKVDGNQVLSTYDSTTGIVSHQSPSRLTDGNHSILVSAKDMSGNEATTSWSFSVSSGYPTVLEYNPIDGTILTKSETPITFKISDPDYISGSGHSIKVNGTLISSVIDFPIGHWEDDSCGGYYWAIDDYTQAVVSGSALNLKDGQQFIEISAKDQIGNTMLFNWGITVAVKPTFSNQSPANGTTVNGNVPITVKVTDNTKVDPLSIVFKVDGNQVPSTYDSTTGVISYQSPSRLTDGNHAVLVSAKDMSGNEAISNWSFSVQNSAYPYPTLLEYKPINGTIVTNSEIPISFKVSDPDTIAGSGHTIKVNGTLISSAINYPIGHWKTDTLGGSTWVIDNYSEAVISGNATNLKDGPQVIDVSAKDALGNQLVFSWGINVAVKPTFSNQSPANGTTVNGNVPITVKVSDNTKVDPLSIIFKVDGNQVTSTYDSTTGIISYQSPTRLTDGNHSILVSAKDISGNEASTTWSFTVLNTANDYPTLLENTPINGTILTKGDTPISFTISDPDTILESGYYIKVNGTAISSYINYPIGHWEEDTCGGSYWVIDDYTKAVISGNASNLKDGLQLIEISAKDRLGNTLLSNWGVTVAANPVFSNQTPASGGAANGLAPISVKVTDNTQVNPLSIVLLLDGTQVSHNFDTTTGVVSYQSPTPLVDGSHTVSITAKDMAGNTASNSWSYTVLNVGPKLTFAEEGKIVTKSAPLFNVLASSSQKINNTTALLEVDGKPIVTNFTYKGHNYYPPYSDDSVWVIDSYNEGTLSGSGANLTDGLHTLKATIADDIRNISQKEWSFMVNLSPSLTLPYPEDQSSTKDNSGFTVKAFDNDKINSSSIVVKLDNVVVPVNFDENTGIISYKPNVPLADGSHTVNITIADTNGNTTVYSWSYIIQTTGPTITNNSLSSFDTYKPSLSVSAKSNVKISDTGTTVLIDGQPVNHSFVYKGHEYYYPYDNNSTWVVDSYTEATIKCNSLPLTDGNHNLSVTVKDVLGNSTTQSWSFTVAQKPTINGQTPANESTINTLSTLISATVSDLNDSSIDKDSIKMLVDNINVIPSISEANGKVTVSYKASNLKNDANHSVSVTAADPSGNSNTSSWRFYLNTKGEMSSKSTDCGTCHTINSYNKYVHSIGPFETSDCDHCHSSYEPQFCGYCHNGEPYSGTTDPSFQSDKDCTYCHTNTQNIYYGQSGNQVVRRQVNLTSNPPQLQTGNVLVHDILPTHYINKGDCNQCHSVYLTREHNRVNKLGIQMNCASCHKSSNTTVQQAVLAKNKDCNACHSSADHEQFHQSNLKIDCQNCHNPNIELEHLKSTITASKNYDCNTCHGSTNIKVKMAIATKSLSCNSCHNESHGLTLGESVPVDIPLLTGFSWTKPIETSFIVGELSMPIGYDPGRYVVSNRRNDITATEVYNSYKDQLNTLGWTLKSEPPAVVGSSFTVEYQKGQRYLYIKCQYKEGVSSGYRIELWYK